MCIMHECALQHHQCLFGMQAYLPFQFLNDELCAFVGFAILLSSMEFEDVIWFVVSFFPSMPMCQSFHVMHWKAHICIATHNACSMMHIVDSLVDSKNIRCLRVICALGCDEPSSFVDSFKILITFVSMIMVTLPRFKLIVRHPYDEA